MMRRSRKIPGGHSPFQKRFVFRKPACLARIQRPMGLLNLITIATTRIALPKERAKPAVVKIAPTGRRPAWADQEEDVLEGAMAFAEVSAALRSKQHNQCQHQFAQFASVDNTEPPGSG